MKARTSDSIIDALGGTGVVSEALELAPNTVSTWRIRGIPSRNWASIVALARKLDQPEITFEALAASVPAEAA